MPVFLSMLFFTLIIVAPFFIIIASIIIIRSNDKFKNPEEYKDAGSAGEREVYLILCDKFHVPENQIFRNVYIPTTNGKTAEIDILVVSKKGLLVFECKNYAGNIYGDMNRKKWIQYLGNTKSFFYNPFLQNRSHISHLKSYLKHYGDLPAISLVTTTERGYWKVKNLKPTDYLLGYNSHLSDVLNMTSDSALMAQHFNAILQTITPLSRPDKSIQQSHIEQFQK